MDAISGARFGYEYAARVEHRVQDIAKQQGEAAVELVEQSAPTRAPGPEGQGSLIDVYA